MDFHFAIIHGTRRMNPNIFADPLNFPLRSQLGSHLSFLVKWDSTIPTIRQIDVSQAFIFMLGKRGLLGLGLRGEDRETEMTERRNDMHQRTTSGIEPGPLRKGLYPLYEDTEIFCMYEVS